MHSSNRIVNWSFQRLSFIRLEYLYVALGRGVSMNLGLEIEPARGSSQLPMFLGSSQLDSYFLGSVSTNWTARSTQPFNWPSVSTPSASTITQPRMERPEMSPWGSGLYGLSHRAGWANGWTSDCPP